MHIEEVYKKTKKRLFNIYKNMNFYRCDYSYVGGGGGRINLTREKGKTWQGKEDDYLLIKFINEN